MKKWTIGGALCLLVASSLGATSARAQADSVKGEVFVVLAKEDEGSIDPALAKMPALRKPPFNAFRSMKVLTRPNIQLSPSKPVEVALPNGRRLRLALHKITPDGRYRVKASINRPNKKDYLPLLQVVVAPGDPFFVAGQSHAGGTLVIGVTLGKKRGF